MATSIEPSTFDLIVLDTGLPQCILASAAASSGHSVLHIDPCSFYGSHWSSLPLADLKLWCASAGSLPFSSLENPTEGSLDMNLEATPVEPFSMHTDLKASPDTNLEAIPLEPFSMHSDFKVTQAVSDEELGFSRDYNIDIATPKLAFCNGPLVDLLLKSGAHNYLQFKSLEASFIWTPEGLSPVPSSRADIFKNKSLTAVEKRHLMRFFKVVTDHASAEPEAPKLSESELELPFVEFLQGRQLPSSVQEIILYAIALANHKQDSTVGDLGSVITTREGMQNLAFYVTSIGRYENAVGPFLYPVYGVSELPQAFSRLAAVNGALYVLRMPVTAILRNQVTGEFEGLQIATGQFIYSKRLVAGPSLYATLSRSFSLEDDTDDFQSLDERRRYKIVRSICITDASLQPDMSTLIVIFPPHSITNKASTVIRAFQAGSDASVCPKGKFIMQLSMVCLDESVGMEAMQTVIRVLFHCVDPSEKVSDDGKPTLLWAVSFVQHQQFSNGFKWISGNHVVVCGLPDEALDYRSVVSSAEKVFQGLFPTDKFFVPKVGSDIDSENH